MPKGIYDRITAKPRPMTSVEERFLSKVQKTNNCWLWTGAKDKAGYGHMRPDPTSRNVIRKAHRVSYELYKGEIDQGLVINHLCRNRGCVNPDHLEATTTQGNIKYRDHNPYRWYEQLEDTLPSCRNERT